MMKRKLTNEADSCTTTENEEKRSRDDQNTSSTDTKEKEGKDSNMEDILEAKNDTVQSEMMPGDPQVGSSGQSTLNGVEIEDKNNEQINVENIKQEIKQELDEPNTQEKNETNSGTQTNDADKEDGKVAIKPEPIESAGECSKVKVERASDNEMEASNSSNVDQKPVGLVSPDDKDKPTSSNRSSCKYGIRCYRRNEIHKIEEAHPGDSDYRRPDLPNPPQGAPVCPYGFACYRRNPIHFQNFSHPAENLVKQNARIRGGKPIVNYLDLSSEEDFSGGSGDDFDPESDDDERDEGVDV